MRAAKPRITEACRNLACSGAVPLGATDNLNMANPHQPELLADEGKRPRTGRRLSCFNAP
jgi:phosphoribosylformylglycinamidine synthase